MIPSLRLALFEPPTTTQIHVVVLLVNPHPQDLRVLRNHHPVPVFCSFDLIRTDGTPLTVVGAGKADFAEGDIEYVVLRQGEAVGARVDVAALVAADDLTPGRYLLTAEYHNQYGVECFTGSVRSPAIELDVAT